MNRALSTPIGGVVLSLVRIVVGSLFACHGAAKMFGIFGGASGVGDTAPFGQWPVWWAGAIELVGGILIAIGLATRVIALICAGEMAYAYFMVHQPTGLFPIENGGEPAALYGLLFLLFVFLGPGSIAVDSLWRRLRRRSGAVQPVAPSLSSR